MRLRFIVMLVTLSLVTSVTPSVLIAQNTHEMEASLKSAGGFERLEILQSLTDHYTRIKNRKSLKYGRQAVKLADNLLGENVNDIRWITSHFLLAKAYYSQEKYFTAKEYFTRVQLIADPRRDAEVVDVTSQYLNRIDSLARTEEGLNQGLISRALTDINLGSSISDLTSNVETKYLMNQAQNAVDKGEYQKAIEIYNKVALEFNQSGQLQQLSQVYRQIGSVFRLMGKDEKATEYIRKASSVIALSETSVPRNEQQRIAKPEAMKSSDSILKTLEGKGYSVETQEIPQVAQADSLSEASYSNTINQLEQRSDKLEELSKQAVEKQDFETLAKLRDQLAELEQDRLELEIIERERNLLAQDVRITELTLKAREEELVEQSRLRKALIGGSLFLATFLISIGFLYSAKRKDHKKLTLAYRNLDVANHKLAQVEKRIKTLLNQQVSGDVASELINSESDYPSKRKYVCIMFLDIRDFTPKVENMTPEQIIQYQNDVFGSMIEIIDRNKGIINQFMGDGFMATFGVPKSRGNDCQNAYNAALEIIEIIKSKSENNTIPETELGIGLHAGDVVTGNVGTDIRKQYSITGTTVILASRLEQLNKEYGTQLILSHEVFEHLDHPPENQGFKVVQIKGVSEEMQIIAL